MNTIETKLKTTATTGEMADDDAGTALPVLVAVGGVGVGLVVGEAPVDGVGEAPPPVTGTETFMPPLQ